MKIAAKKVVIVSAILALCIASCKRESPAMTYHQAMQACLDEHDSLRRANPNQVFIFYSSDKLVGAYAPDTIGQMISGELVDRNFFL